MDSLMQSASALLPWLMAMAVLLIASAMFSCGEAAFFYLSHQDRAIMRRGNSAQKMAAALVDRPDRLLTAILFWNLFVNILYFSLATIAGSQVRVRDGEGDAATVVFGFAALLTIIFFGEMLPKSLGVHQARWMATLLGLPLAVAVRLLDPVMSLIQAVNLASRRLIWPKFEPEKYLDVADLERAVELSTSDADLLEQERSVLQKIVGMTDIRVDEIMRPRTQFLAFQPPIHLDDVRTDRPRSGYVLVAESASDDIVAAIPLADLRLLPKSHLERYAEPVSCVPWCANLGSAWDEMFRRRRNVIAVVSEYGETIGILTRDDILETIFSPAPSRSKRLLDRQPILQIAPGVWQVTGMTSLRRLATFFQLNLPDSKSTTVKGLVQELLQRLPREGDTCQTGPFAMTVIEAPHRGELLVELQLRLPEGKES